MKKITFLIFLLASAITFGQSLPLDYEDTTTTASFQFGTLGFANIANPDVSAGNMSARVLQVDKLVGANWFAGFGYETPGSPLINLANGTSFTMKIWSTKANLQLRFQIQIGLSGEPTYNRDVVVTNANTWTEVTFDFSDQPGLTGMEQYSTLVIQPDYDPALEGPAGDGVLVTESGTYYIDDIVQVGAPEPTCMDGVQNGMETGVDCGGPDCPTCPETCDDGIQNQDETGVDCGGASCPACPPAGPTMAAPEFPSTGTDLYVYSGLPGSSVGNFNFYAFGNVGVPEVDIEMNGNNAGRIEGGGFFFYGAQWDAEDLVAGGYQFVHLNYYATTTTEFNFFLIDATAGIGGGAAEEPRYRFGGPTPDSPIVTGSWQSVFIPLQHFLDHTPSSGTYDLNDIFQWKFDGNGEVYFDNIFFSTSNTLGAEEFTRNEFSVFPNPTTNNWTVIGTQDIESIRIYDVLGKQVVNVTPNANETQIDGSNLKAGLYFAKISSATGSKTIKLVKK
ncbi:T9SS type A sorting domain-containing protein [uncultured Psychroserpens sp.]|uniref:T9SS type A sorting domain-containing protein n=1 Tax=uncultured Psychroserpens sp. TaxID=255436 RepID=UPI00262B240E|nr:T9SS type A sorting domain-containing protein [uncultured Psychroserpens sp.]